VRPGECQSEAQDDNADYTNRAFGNYIVENSHYKPDLPEGTVVSAKPTFEAFVQVAEGCAAHADCATCTAEGKCAWQSDKCLDYPSGEFDDKLYRAVRPGECQSKEQNDNAVYSNRAFGDYIIKENPYKPEETAAAEPAPAEPAAAEPAPAFLQRSDEFQPAKVHNLYDDLALTEGPGDDEEVRKATQAVLLKADSTLSRLDDTFAAAKITKFVEANVVV